MRLKKVQEQTEVVKKASTIVENSKIIEEKMEKTNDMVKTYKEDIQETYAQILKEKEEIKQQRVDKIDIIKEVKDVIRSNPRFIKDTVDINKSVVFFGLKQDDIINRFERDKHELENISKMMNTIIGEGDEITVEEFSRLGKYVPNVDRPLKVTLQNTSMVEMVLRNAKKIREKEEWKNVWVNRCLNREDREKLKEKVEEAKKKNDERSEEEARHFFYKVVGMQVKKWYISRGATRF